jgi:hypothetical protein
MANSIKGRDRTQSVSYFPLSHYSKLIVTIRRSEYHRDSGPLGTKRNIKVTFEWCWYGHFVIAVCSMESRPTRHIPMLRLLPAMSRSASLLVHANFAVLRV